MSAVCLATDCARPAKKRGLCDACYRVARYGAPSVEAGARARWDVELPAPSPQAAAARAKRKPTPPRASADVGAQIVAWVADGTLQRLLLPWADEGEMHARRTVTGELVASVEEGDVRANLRIAAFHVAAPPVAPGGDCLGWARDVDGARSAADAIAWGMGWRLL